MKGGGALLALLVALGIGVGVYYFRTHVLEDPAWEHTLELDGSSIRLKRNPANGGMFEIYGKDHLDYARALGYVHAKDRLVQMELQRLAGQGRLSEALKSDVGLIAVDTYFRSLNFVQEAREAVPKLAADAKAFLDAYCRGVNFYLDEHSSFWEQPIEFLMIQHRPEPWSPEHSLITAKLMAYVGLAETQGEIEKLIMQSIKGGVSMDALRAIFPTQLKNVESEVVDCIKEADLQIPTIPVEVKFAPYIPAFKASNNWVIGPQLTKSGSPLQCYDPHLDIARLPAIWYEFVFHYETPAKRYLVGVSVPGMPGIFFGRNNDVTFGVTYGFMDQIDFFFEKVQNGKYLREVETTDEQGNKAVRQEWHEFQVRKEILKQKEGADVELVFYENDNGVIERKSYTGPLPDGLHLARKWAWREFEASDTSVLYPPPSDVKTVAEFHDIARNVPLSANWLNADRQGNIGYQQSGRLPARDPSVNSALPLLGWKASHRWNGSVDTNQLLQVINPAKGYLATANDDLQNPAPGAPKAINYHMGFYRVSRINELIENKGKDHLETPDNGKPTWDEEDMKRFQLDVYSKQGEYYMELLAPILKAKLNCTSCKTLLEWDGRFSTDSVGATVFTQFREALLDKLFGENVFGKDVWMHMTRESGVMLVFQWYFDRVLLWDIFEREGIKNAFFDFTEDNAYIHYLWNEFLVDHEDATTGKPGREGKNGAAQARRSQLLERVVDEYLVPRNVARERTYGSDHAMMMKNIFFDGKLPGSVALGLDVGPVPLAGSGSTVNQGSLFREQGREQSFCPSYRFISDLSQDWAYTAIPGAISGRRFSGLYTDSSFFRGLYKKVSAA